MNNVTLLGVENIRSAGSQIKVAASEMQSAASMISDEFHRMKLFLDDWLYRFEEILKDNQSLKTSKSGHKSA